MSKREGELLAVVFVAVASALIFGTGALIRFAWPVFPAVAAYAFSFGVPTAGVVCIGAALLAVVAIATGRQIGESSSLHPLWRGCTLHPVKAALIVLGPLLAAPIGMSTGVTARREEAQAAEQTRVKEEREAARGVAAQREADHMAEVRRDAEARAAATAAAIEAARLPSERAATALSALHVGGDSALTEARRILDPIRSDARCARDVAPAFRAVHEVEMRAWRALRTEALADRMAQCCDGAPSPSCACSDIHSGCCSHHGGVCGCTSIDVGPAPVSALRCRSTPLPSTSISLMRRRGRGSTS